MTEAQLDLAFALNMYGEKSVEYARAKISNSDVDGYYNSMCFWQEQVWHCAKAIAEIEQAQ
jgi:hypothetical protein